jgi:hypothetical protein
MKYAIVMASRMDRISRGAARDGNLTINETFCGRFPFGFGSRAIVSQHGRGGVNDTYAGLTTWVEHLVGTLFRG